MSKRKKKHRICVSCGGDTWSQQFQKPIEETRCRSCAHKGSNNSNWKGGVKKAGKYIFVLSPSHPNANTIGYVKRANLVWEQNTGHYPDWSKCEVLHHIDGDKYNDAFENLQLMTSSEHMSLHSKQTGFKSGQNNPNYKHGRHVKKK